MGKLQFILKFISFIIMCICLILGLIFKSKGDKQEAIYSLLWVLIMQLNLFLN